MTEKIEMSNALPVSKSFRLVAITRLARPFDSGTPPAPQPDYGEAAKFINALCGSPFADVTVPLMFRLIDVAGDDAQALARLFGTLAEHFHTIDELNRTKRLCVFVVVNEMSAAATSGAVQAMLDQVHAIRSHFVDLDDVRTAAGSVGAACIWTHPPTIIVNSSPNKYHCYWPVQPYRNNDAFTGIQSKFMTLFGGDNVTDATRIMRLPGTLHHKGEPYLVTCQVTAAPPYAPQVLYEALAHIQAATPSTSHTRHPLGHPPLAAPSLDAVRNLLAQVKPDTLNNDEWSELYRAAKQAAWSHAEPQVIRAMLDAWCDRYAENKPHENDKLWRNTRKTTIGWPWIKFKYGTAVATAMFAGAAMPGMSLPAVQATGELKHAEQPAPPAVPLSGPEQAEWFKGCTYISTLDKIRTPSGRLMSEHQFNGTFGGPRYWMSPTGEQEPTNNSWKAATHGVLFQVPKVDHVRFDPLQPPGSIIVDDLNRRGVNTWIPPTVHTEPGDITPWLNHLAMMFPDAHDRHVLLGFMAYCARFPGVKVAWAPLIQSCEGAGKNLIKYAMQHALGASYCYEAKSDQLAETGGKFNAWMREKLMIIADEIKTDEKRKLVEILKPFITERRIEIQGKGADQVQEDNAANLIFFTNYQDAIPVTIDSRRYAVLFSALQSHRDLLAAGFDDQYFKRLYHWMDNGGKPRIAHYLQNYAIGIDQMPGRAPHTTSTTEAVEASRSPVEQLIINAVDDDQPGFRRGWISTTALGRLAKEQDVKLPGPSKIGEIIAKLGYRKIGKAGQCYFTENRATRPTLYHRDATSRLATYATDQGYEPAPVLSLIPGGRS